NGTRGLQRVGRRVGLLPARPRAIPGVPVERGRARRDLRRPAALLLRAGVLERPGPDPQGADLRAVRARGQPRRGPQGVLVVRRLDAQPLLMRWRYHYPQAPFPYAELARV